ncbi:hypothetical protein TNCV_367151 [Trichonephila clavipes]|nr:hypothetical protein TNCV_367151 [Trichonephila clavipes]
MENQLVLLKDPNTKPLDWPMGRILEVFLGSDGLVRVVNVKTSTGILKRAITKKTVFQRPSDDEIVTSVQESDPDDDETDENKNNDNNESSKGPLNSDLFSALETAFKSYERQPECCRTQLLLIKRISDLAAIERRCTMLMPHLQNGLESFIPQLDGVSLHWSVNVRDYLEEHVPHRRIRRVADTACHLSNDHPEKS